MYMSVLPECMHACLLPSEIKRGSQIPLELELNKDGGEPPCGWWELNPGPLQDH